MKQMHGGNVGAERSLVESTVPRGSEDRLLYSEINFIVSVNFLRIHMIYDQIKDIEQNKACFSY